MSCTTKNRNPIFFAINPFFKHGLSSLLVQPKSAIKYLFLIANFLLSGFLFAQNDLFVAQNDSSVFYVTPQTTVAGINEVFVGKPIPNQTPTANTEKNTQYDLRVLAQEQRDDVIFITENTIFYTSEKLNLVYLPTTVQKENKTPVAIFKKKLRTIKVVKDQATAQAQALKYNPLPYNGNKNLYSSWQTPVVVAPTTNIKKLNTATTTAVTYCQEQFLAKEQKQTTTGYTNPIVAYTIPIALYNRPPPFG